jgi:hypothetical protein
MQGSSAKAVQHQWHILAIPTPLPAAAAAAAFVPPYATPQLHNPNRFGLAFGESVPGSAGLFGNPADLGGLMYKVGAAPLASLAATIPLSLFFVFQLVFAVVTPALIIGSVADR